MVTHTNETIDNIGISTNGKVVHNNNNNAKYLRRFDFKMSD